MNAKQLIKDIESRISEVKTNTDPMFDRQGELSRLNRILEQLKAEEAKNRAEKRHADKIKARKDNKKWRDKHYLPLLDRQLELLKELAQVTKESSLVFESNPAACLQNVSGGNYLHMIGIVEEGLRKIERKAGNV